MGTTVDGEESDAKTSTMHRRWDCETVSVFTSVHISSWQLPGHNGPDVGDMRLHKLHNCVMERQSRSRQKLESEKSLHSSGGSQAP